MKAESWGRSERSGALGETSAVISGELSNCRRHRRSRVISQYLFNCCNMEDFPLSAIAMHINLPVQYAVLSSRRCCKMTQCRESTVLVLRCFLIYLFKTMQERKTRVFYRRFSEDCAVFSGYETIVGAVSGSHVSDYCSLFVYFSVIIRRCLYESLLRHWINNQPVVLALALFALSTVQYNWKNIFQYMKSPNPPLTHIFSLHSDWQQTSHQSTQPSSL